MSARSKFEVWQQVKRRVKDRIADRKLRHARFWKLQGAAAKKAVIEGAVARLMAPDALFPYALRKRLAPRPLVVKGVPTGWLGSWRPVDSLQWAAWLTVHEQHIEHGEFWFEKSAAADELIDKAIDAERRAYCSATSDCGGPTDGKLDPEALENLSRLTEAGQALALEPTREIEQQKGVEDFTAALEQRVHDAEEEFAKLVPALNAYASKLRCRKQRRAFGLICNEPQLKGFEIATKCRISEATVSKLRANFEEMTERFFALYTLPEEDAPVARVHDETVTQIAEAGEVEGAEIDATAMAVGLKLGSTTVHSDVLDMACDLQAPDVDEEVSETALLAYSRRTDLSWLARDKRWSGGRQMYSDVELVTGSRYGGSYDDPAKIALRDGRKQHANKFSEVEMRELRQRAEAADFAINGFLRAIDSFLAKRAAESVDDLMGATIEPK